MAYRILVVDDEADILEFVGYTLRKAGYEVETASDGRQAVDKTLAWHPHLILLDAMMPVMNGFDACRMIRTTKGIDDTLIVFLTARGDERSEVRGFKLGADDYIAKPIQLRALSSRIKAILKRKEHAVEVGQGIRVDAGTVTRDGKDVPIQRREFRLLEVLHGRPGKLFSRGELLAEVWGDEVVGDRTIDVHVRNLRRKIGDDHIVTVKGRGYKYQD